MEKKKYEMPQVEVRELEGEVLMQAKSGMPEVSDAPTRGDLGSEANRDNVWEDLW